MTPGRALPLMGLTGSAVAEGVGEIGQRRREQSAENGKGGAIPDTPS